MPVGIHDLKTVQPYFDQVKAGIKNFELRQYTEQRCGSCTPCINHKLFVAGTGCRAPKPARDFQVGDTLFFRNADNLDEFVEREIEYILRDTDPQMEDKLAPGYCVLGLKYVHTA